MADIQETYRMTLKDGLYYKKDGSAFGKKNSCNLVRGKLQGDGYKVTAIPVTGGYALRVLKLDNTSTANEPIERDDMAENKQEQPIAGTAPQGESVEELRNRLAQLEERDQLNRAIAEKQSAITGGNGTEPKSTRGNAPAGRPKRTPFDFNRLKFPNRPGYRRRVFNDVNTRVQQAEAAGWKVVEDPFATVDSDRNVNAPSQMGKGVNRHVGTDESLKSITGVLMEIPEEYFEEDQMAKQQVVDRSEDGLRQVNRDGVTGGLAVGDQSPEKSWRN